MLQKTPIAFGFAKGLDTKTDPKQVSFDNFLSLQNAIFDKGGLLQKRNGFAPLGVLPSDAYTFLTTLNGNLTAFGPDVAAFNEALGEWVTKGSFYPITVGVLPLIRNASEQTQGDSAVAPNGLVCTVYTQQTGSVILYRYCIADSVTGQNIVSPTDIPASGGGTLSGSPRVFILGEYFIIGFCNLISSSFDLQYICISSNNPTVSTAPENIAAGFSGLQAWDAVADNAAFNLFIAYSTASGGQSIQVKELPLASAVLGAAPSASITFAGATDIANIFSLCIDYSTSQFYIAFALEGADANYYVASINLSFTAVVFNPTPVAADGIDFPVANLASAAQNGVCTIFSEQVDSYNYDNQPFDDFVNFATVSSAGVASGVAVSLRGVGLASKAFIDNSVIYYLAAIESPFQSSYFLIDGSLSTSAAPTVVAKLAYSNGGGSLSLGLPSVTFVDGSYQIAYRIKDSVEALTTDPNSAQMLTSGGVFSQTGLGLAKFTFSESVVVAETEGALHATGGFVWEYDGYLPAEHGFFLWPEAVEAIYSATGVTPTGHWASGSTTITVSNGTGIFPGLLITDSTNPTYIPAGTKIVSVAGTTVVISNPTTHTVTSGSPDTLAIQGSLPAEPDGSTHTDAYYYVATYEWTDNQGNLHRSAPSIPFPVTTSGSASTGYVVVHLPTLRLTYKIANPLTIVVYRWSVGQQVYHQVTSFTNPVVNDTTIDSIDFVDIQPDSAISGNNILYTTGGVLENIAAPATNIITQFDNRVWIVDAEDQNLYWFSKQLIEGVPVEFSDLLTYYVAPATAAQGPTGPITSAAPLDDKLITFKTSAIYYVNGTGPDNAGANSQYNPAPIFITASVGCANQNSIVIIPQGLMFQSNKGIWLLGRDLSTSYIGAPVEVFNSALVTSAVNVPNTNQVRFTLDSGVTLMYDYYFQQWGEFTNLPAVSSTIYKGLEAYVAPTGQTFLETPGEYLDNSNPVLLQITTSWLKLAGLQGYQRAYFFYLLGQYFSPHKLIVSVSYDYNPAARQVNTIQPDNYSPFYGGDGADVASPYGNESPYGGPGDLEQWRIFLSKQRCQAVQLSIQEIYDSALGQPAGKGFELSGIMAILGFKSGFRTMNVKNSVG